MKQKKPDQCKGCRHHHKAGHKQGTALHGSRFDNWCCKYSTAAPRAVSICKVQGGKPSNVELTGLRRSYGEGPVERHVGRQNGGTE